MSSTTGRGQSPKWTAVLEATKKVLARFPGQLGIRMIWYRLISPPFQVLPQSEGSYKAFDAHMVRWREEGSVSPRRISDRTAIGEAG